MHKDLFERLRPGDSIRNSKISNTPFTVYENFAGGKRVEVIHFKTITKSTLHKWVDANNRPIASVDTLQHRDVVKHKHLGFSYMVGLVSFGEARCTYMLEVSTDDAAHWHLSKAKHWNCG